MLSMGLLYSPGFVTVRSISDAVDRDGIEKLLVRTPTEGRRRIGPQTASPRR